MKPSLPVILSASWLALTGCASGASEAPSHPQDLIPASEKRAASTLQNPVLFTLPGMDQVLVGSVDYGSGLVMDIYYPPAFDFSAPKPAVVFVFGIPDEEAILQFGSPFKDMGQYISWGQLVAASGLIGVTYDTGRSPFGAANDPISYLSRNGEYLGIDTSSICLWSGSGHSTAALRLLTDTSHPYFSSIVCGVIFYGDAQLAKPLSPDIPLLVVEAGMDTAATNRQLEQFVDQARAANVQVEFVTYAEGVHAFEINQDTDETREIVGRTLEFLKDQLLSP